MEAVVEAHEGGYQLQSGRFTNATYFVQHCNIAMYFMKPFHCPHSPWSWNVAPNTLKYTTLQTLNVFLTTLQ